MGEQNDHAKTVTPYRPVGDTELDLIRHSGFRTFPPRLPDQPIFYPVTNEAYACQIARDWNTKFNSRIGHMTRFDVNADYLGQFDRRIVGGREHEEYWIPSEHVAEFNEQIVGEISVIATFTEADRLAYERKDTSNA
jgi:hypothetical protein